MPAVRRPGAAMVAVALAVAGLGLIVLGWQAPAAIPPPPLADAPPNFVVVRPESTGPESTGPARTGPESTGPGVGRSVPVGLDIPAIRLRTRIVAIGLRPDHTLDVPPLRSDAPAGWYDESPTPGESGSAVIAGHVDSARDGPAVFYRLRLLRPGDRITVFRADGGSVRFVVTGLASYAKTAFPTARVYGPAGFPALNLITCGGLFDRARGSYRDNLVVFTAAVPG